MLGYVERISLNAVHGWVEPAPKGAKPRIAEAVFRGEVIGRAAATAPRPDVETVTRGNANCGFVIEIAPPYDVDEVDVIVEGKVLPKLQAPPQTGSLLPGAARKVASRHLDGPLRVTTPQPGSRDIEICQLLIATYRQFFGKRDEIYETQRSRRQRPFNVDYRNLATIVENGNAQELCNYLLHIHKRPESEGISQGPESYYLLRNALPGSAVHNAQTDLCRRELLSLAEYLEAIPVANPSQGRVHKALDLAHIVLAIGSRTGIDPIFPHATGGLFCLDTGAGLIQQRDVWALYAALRMTSLLPNPSTSRVCEIGGGLGQLCHYARLLGVGQYVMIDLPHVSLLQAFLLMRANPGRRIALFNGGDFDADADICIYPTFMYQRAPDLHFDLTVNVSSMPEMGWADALSYARTTARKSAGFLSINQEVGGVLAVGDARQVSVAEVLAAVPELRQSYRFRSWVRRGYVESYYVGEAARASSTSAAP